MSAAVARRKPSGRPPVSETPHQIIEGEAYETCAELLLYRDNERLARLRADELCADDIRRAQQALEDGNILTAQAALRDYWKHDAIENAAGEGGDFRVAVAHMHAQIIPAAVVEIEMGACPSTAMERGATTRCARRSARAGRPTGKGAR